MKSRIPARAHITQRVCARGYKLRLCAYIRHCQEMTRRSIVHNDDIDDRMIIKHTYFNQEKCANSTHTFHLFPLLAVIVQSSAFHLLPMVLYGKEDDNTMISVSSLLFHIGISKWWWIPPMLFIIESLEESVTKVLWSNNTQLTQSKLGRFFKRCTAIK